MSASGPLLGRTTPTAPQVRALELVRDGEVNYSRQRGYRAGSRSIRADVIQRCVNARWAEPAYVCRQCAWIPVRLTDLGRRVLAAAVPDRERDDEGTTDG